MRAAARAGPEGDTGVRSSGPALEEQRLGLGRGRLDRERCAVRRPGCASGSSADGVAVEPGRAPAWARRNGPCAGARLPRWRRSLAVGVAGVTVQRLQVLPVPLGSWVGVGAGRGIPFTPMELIIHAAIHDARLRTRERESGLGRPGDPSFCRGAPAGPAAAVARVTLTDRAICKLGGSFFPWCFG